MPVTPAAAQKELYPGLHRFNRTTENHMSCFKGYGATTAAVVLTILTIGTAVAQPASPPKPVANPQSKPGATIVINPTEDECRSGWNASLRWTKEQFDAFCSQLKTSK
jgi:hypothetical protein